MISNHKRTKDTPGREGFPPAQPGDPVIVPPKDVGRMIVTDLVESAMGQLQAAPWQPGAFKIGVAASLEAIAIVIHWHYGEDRGEAYGRAQEVIERLAGNASDLAEEPTEAKIELRDMIVAELIKIKPRCGHPRFADSDHCAEMICPNYYSRWATD